MKKLLFASVIAALSLTACSEGESVSEQHTAPAEPELSVPGVISVPGDNGFTQLVESSSDAILLYCWIPLGDYSESTADLDFIRDLEELGITPVPVQFSTHVRNSAQNQLNSLGIPLPVALGDDSLRAFMAMDELPAAVLVTSTGEESRATGFGCAERAVRSLR